MTIVYIVLNEDRHIDVDPTVYTDPDRAVAAAKDIALFLAASEDDIEPYDAPPDHLYAVRCGEEGDAVRVVACELDPA